MSVQHKEQTFTQYILSAMKLYRNYIFGKIVKSSTQISRMHVSTKCTNLTNTQNTNSTQKPLTILDAQIEQADDKTMIFICEFKLDRQQQKFIIVCKHYTHDYKFKNHSPARYTQKQFKPASIEKKSVITHFKKNPNRSHLQQQMSW